MKARMPAGYGRPDMNALMRQAQKMQEDMKAKQAEAMAMMDGNVRTHMIGDCDKVGCIQTGVRAAYALANNI